MQAGHGTVRRPDLNSTVFCQSTGAGTVIIKAERYGTVLVVVGMVQ